MQSKTNGSNSSDVPSNSVVLFNYVWFIAKKRSKRFAKWDYRLKDFHTSTNQISWRPIGGHPGLSVLWLANKLILHSMYIGWISPLCTKFAKECVQARNRTILINNEEPSTRRLQLPPILNCQLICKGPCFICACVSSSCKKNQRSIHPHCARHSGQGLWTPY